MGALDCCHASDNKDYQLVSNENYERKYVEKIEIRITLTKILKKFSSSCANFRRARAAFNKATHLLKYLPAIVV